MASAFTVDGRVMKRLALYASVWLLCNLAIGGCIAGLGALLMFYTAVGPFACVYVGARLGTWCGFDLGLTGPLMLGGLWLFGSIRLRLYRRVLRLWRRGFRFLASTTALRDDLWRQYCRTIKINR